MYGRARQELRALAKDGVAVILPWPTLAEAYSLVLYRLGARRAHRFAKDLVEGAEILNPSPVDYVQALGRLRAFRDLSVSLFDGVLAVLSERLATSVWTYDNHFRVLGVTVWE